MSETNRTGDKAIKAKCVGWNCTIWVLGYRPQVPVPVPVPIPIFWVEKICTHYPPGYIFSRKKVPITYPYPYPPGYTRVLGYFLSKSNWEPCSLSSTSFTTWGKITNSLKDINYCVKLYANVLMAAGRTKASSQREGSSALVTAYRPTVRSNCKQKQSIVSTGSPSLRYSTI